MRFRILFLLLVVSGSYSLDVEADYQRPPNDTLRATICATECGDPEENDVCLPTSIQSQHNISDSVVKAPFKVEGLNAKVSQKVGNIFNNDVCVTWCRPHSIPDFYIVKLIYNGTEANDTLFQNVSGTATGTAFLNVTISQQFNVSIRAWAWGEGGVEISERFSKSRADLGLDSMVVTVLTIVVSLPFVYVVYAYFNHRRRTRRQKRTK